jgi:hypothetical protein
MRSLRWITVMGLVGSIGLCAAGPSEAGAAQKRGKHHESVDVRAADSRAHLSFAPREVQVIREYYAPRYRRLPPGLQKKYRRTGHLAPGWQKKLEPFPVVIERQLFVVPGGYRRGVVDRHAVVFNTRTHVINHVVALF